MKQPIRRILDWLGEDLDREGRRRLKTFTAWLETEAIPAGGLGPREASRVEDRHVSDSLSFAAGFDADAETALDIGTGVGLPGIPLAILRPRCHFLLLDRSGRRADLAARALRVVGLTNAGVVQDDVDTHRGRYDVIVMRAALTIADAIGHFDRLLSDEGVAVIGLTRSATPADVDPARRRGARHGFRIEAIEIPVLDSPGTLLRITRA